MKKITERLLSWASLLEDNTLEQARTSSRMPFIYPHLALMPDAHLGLGATVGSVIPTLGAVMPAAVGVDIGCGMIAVRTQFTASDVDARVAAGSPLREQIERAIPLSAGGKNNTIVTTAEPRIDELRALASESGFDPATYVREWERQLGTLGSGNHFIEVSLDETDAVWVFLHSGSRGIGNRIAQHHIKVAQALMSKWWIELPDRDLAYLVEGTAEFDRYITELRWAQRFALLNREEMMDRVIRQLSEWMTVPIVEQERINCHHNFTEKETHYGKSVWLSLRARSRRGRVSRGSFPVRWERPRTWWPGSATPSRCSRRRTGRAGRTRGRRRGEPSRTSSCVRRWWESSFATPTLSSTRFPRRTSRSTR
ncbi:MAG: transferase [Subtercola sp.]|nr:transferase [Subtercola sp.]